MNPHQPAPEVGTLLLGVDGGGTSTVALLATADDPPRVLARGEGGPSNRQDVGIEAALGALDRAVSAVFAVAGLPRGPVAAACLGLAGVGRVADREPIHDWAVRVHLARRYEVTTDVDLLLPAGTPQGWGLAVVAGTGSIALGCTADGRTARAGGWGPILGDEGSAYVLVLSALRAVTRASDGRAPYTLLRQRLLDRMRLNNVEELIPALHQGHWDRTALATLAPLVFEAAALDDPVARALAEQGARELALTTAAVARKLNLDRQPVPLALAGGVLVAESSYRERFIAELRKLDIQPDPLALVSEPAEGGLRRAKLLS